MGPPPGGPEDFTPPHLLATHPESLATYPDFHGDVEFLFDEVVAEGSQPSQGLGTSDLERLVLLSPAREVPVVKWKRDRITVHPREGWKPDRVYRVELLPGIFDLRRNRSDSRVVVTFSTGAPLPSMRLSGQAIDWVGQKLGRGAVIEAVLSPDSLVYRAIADSSGRFSIGPLPQGEYLVFASLDQNRNLRRDGREAFDSSRVRPDSTTAPLLWIFPHDTIGPKIKAVTPIDSLSATVEFTQPLDPNQQMDPASVRLRLLPDSIPVAVHSLLPKRLDDSLQALARAQADSAKPADTAAVAPLRKPGEKPGAEKPGGARPTPGPAAPAGRRTETQSDTTMRKLLSQRPPLTDKLILRAEGAFTPVAKYVLEVNGIRNVNRAAADAWGGLSVPKAPRPTTADSLRPNPPADSVSKDSTVHLRAPLGRGESGVREPGALRRACGAPAPMSRPGSIPHPALGRRHRGSRRAFSLYTRPGPAEWEIMVNRSILPWGNDLSDQMRAQEVGHTTVAAESTSSLVEAFTVHPDRLDGDSLMLMLEWENTRVRLPIVRR